MSSKKTDFWAMGCYGTVINPEHEGGVIRLYEIEIQLKHPICQLHFNELPLRALFNEIEALLDGL